MGGGAQKPDPDIGCGAHGKGIPLHDTEYRSRFAHDYQPPPQPEDLLITTEVMAILRTTKNTLCKWVRENGLPATKMPDNSYRFDPIELLDWWQNRQV